MTIFIKAPPPRFDPPGWTDYNRLAKIAFKTGLFARAAVVNRFHARYRLARAFRGMTLEGYSPMTAAGYDALTKITLHWSAFESMLSALGIDGVDIPKLAKRFNDEECLRQVRQADPSNRFFRFVHSHMDDRRHRDQIAKYIDGEPCSSIALAKAIRHIFLHGPLTPNASQARPEDVKVLCDRLSRSLVAIIDGEFSGRVSDLVELLGLQQQPDEDDCPF